MNEPSLKPPTGFTTRTPGPELGAWNFFRPLSALAAMLVTASMLAGCGLGAAATPPTPSPTPAPVVWLDQQGVGTPPGVDPQFVSRSSPWTLAWSYNCGKVKSQYFSITLYDPSYATTVNQDIVDSYGRHGAGTKTVSGFGDRATGIVTTCSWHIRAESGISSAAPPLPRAGYRAALPTATPVPPPTSTPRPTPTPKPTPTPHPTATPAPVLLDIGGSGAHTTQSFTAVASTWQIHYRFTCGAFGNAPQEFQILVFQPNGTLANLAANTVASSGADVDYEHQAGAYYLEVNTVCSWHLQVTE